MTANRNAKRRIRARARETGESYTAALWRSREEQGTAGADQTRPRAPRRVEKTEFGLALHVPDGWLEIPPDLRNSPWEVARFQAPGGDPSCIVVRNPIEAGLDAYEVARSAQRLLEAEGFRDLRLTAATMAGAPAACLAYQRATAAAGAEAVRHYFLVIGRTAFGLRLASRAPERDTALLEAVTAGFELVGLVGETALTARASRPAAGRDPGVFEKPEFGFSLRLPGTWIERPPSLVANPWEVARFIERGDGRHVCIVSRRPRAGGTAAEAAEEVRGSLEASGFGSFSMSEVVVAGHPAVRVTGRLSDAGRVWAVHNYHLVAEGIGFTLHFATAMPEQDAALLETIVAGFRLLARD